MTKKHLSITTIAVFMCLFFLYQAAEISIRIYNNIPAFLGLMLLTIVAGYFLTKKAFDKSIFVFETIPVKRSGLNLLAGLGCGIATYLGAYFISKTLSLEVPGAHPGWSEFVTSLLIFAAGTLLPSLAEDILTRGYLFATWPGRHSHVALVLLSSVIYVLNHIYALNKGPALIIYLFITGISLAIPMVYTRSIWYTFGLHWACNIIYRMSNDILKTNGVTNGLLSSLNILTIILVCFIPINILAIKLLNGKGDNRKYA